MLNQKLTAPSFSDIKKILKPSPSDVKKKIENCSSEEPLNQSTDVNFLINELNNERIKKQALQQENKHLKKQLKKAMEKLEEAKNIINELQKKEGASTTFAVPVEKYIDLSMLNFEDKGESTTYSASSRFFSTSLPTSVHSLVEALPPNLKSRLIDQPLLLESTQDEPPKLIK
jgi:predicted nuclease with TOPRIM domain